MAPSTILILGGAGFIGSNLTRHLLESGFHEEQVVVTHRPGGDLRNLQGARCRTLAVDLTSEVSIANALQPLLPECATVYNLAGCGSPLKRDAEQRRLVNVVFPGLLADMLMERDGVRLVHVGSSSAVGYPANGVVADETFPFNAHWDEYAASKRLGVDAVLARTAGGLDAVIAHPCSTVGAHGMKKEQLGTFRAIAKGAMRVYPAGGLCLTGMQDLVRGLSLCAAKGRSGEAYLLGGHNISYHAYFSRIAMASGGRAPFIKLPARLMPFLGYCVEHAARLVGREVGINANVARMVSSTLYYSSAKACTELGYAIAPWQTTLDAVVAEVVGNLHRESA